MAIFELDMRLYIVPLVENYFHLSYSDINFSMYKIKYRILRRIKIEWRLHVHLHLFMSMSTFYITTKKLQYVLKPKLDHSIVPVFGNLNLY